ncbi:aquaporin [Orbus mooreae]
MTIGLSVGRRFPIKEILPYIIAQVIGGILAAAIIYIIATGNSRFSIEVNGFAANGVGEHSPEGYSFVAGLVCEIVMTFFFLMVILGSTHGKAPAGFAPIAIGLCLTLIHLISIPVTNTSVNPARATSQAVFVQGWALEQLWIF